MNFPRPRVSLSSKLVPTQKLMTLALTGIHSTNPRIRDAAESVLSLMLHQLKRKHVSIPAECEKYLDLLTGEK